MYVSAGSISGTHRPQGAEMGAEGLCVQSPCAAYASTFLEVSLHYLESPAQERMLAEPRAAVEG